MSEHLIDTHLLVPSSRSSFKMNWLSLGHLCFINTHTSFFLQENDCIKRPMKCIYCQLEFPKDALNPHLDYCGSRTEQCSKCLQYIKLKDQTKHEESNCQFPEVRPKNNNRSDFASGLSELNGGQHGMHSFAFDELSRVIGQRAVGEPSVPQRPSRIGESKTDNARPRLNRHVKVQNLSRPTVSKSNLNRKILTSKGKACYLLIFLISPN